MEKYAQWKFLFRDTKWLLSNMTYRGRDDRAVWACAVAPTTWQLQCQLAPWKSNKALLVFCGHRVWNLLTSTEEWRFNMETAVWVRGELKPVIRSKRRGLLSERVLLLHERPPPYGCAYSGYSTYSEIWGVETSTIHSGLGAIGLSLVWTYERTFAGPEVCRCQRGNGGGAKFG